MAADEEHKFYWAGVHAVVHRWKNTVDKDGDCVEEDRHCAYNVTLRLVRSTIFVVQKQYYVF